ncbi:hypothetical protein HK104_009687 [Borealophlyctis nickersoniae]|nr:hypothetical protein HK104_009687 [Borealophlyctis nickersoniae]
MSRATQDWLCFYAPERAALYRRVRVALGVKGKGEVESGGVGAMASGGSDRDMGPVVHCGAKYLKDRSEWEDGDIAFDPNLVQQTVAAATKAKSVAGTAGTGQPPSGKSEKPPVGGMASAFSKRPYPTSTRR